MKASTPKHSSRARADKNKGGRPAKFAEPSRPITVTLPERILSRLEGIDIDRAKAIVKAVDTALDGPGHPPLTVGELDIGGGESLLAVADNRFLRRIPWLTLIEVAPGRHLLSLKEGATLEKLEVTLRDFLESPEDATPAELELLDVLCERLRAPRRNRAVRPESILIIRTAPSGRTGK